MAEVCNEKTLVPSSGWGMLFVLLCGLATIPVVIGLGANGFFSSTMGVVVGVFLAVMAVAIFIGLFGLMAIQPNDARVLLLFGDYRGTVTKSGFYWVNPFFSKKKISLRIRNFETGATNVSEKKNEAGQVIQAKSRTHGRPSKVNDRDGNPIEISAVVVWKVVNTAEALFQVDDYEDYVAVQSEAALRNLATRHPYDSEDHQMSLRGSTQEVSDQLRHDIQERLDNAGMNVIEARISHLAYAPEIASAMLQRQQAHAVIAARAKIVEGAVGMVQLALNQLSRDKIVELDDERRAAMVSNLMVVLCSGSNPHPVLNVGSLYS
jgi:regulator of protease activity HflC (stomatin/prohibitin superfamily)